jgi:hypothetical protein
MKKIIRNARDSTVKLEKKTEITIKAWDDLKAADKDNILRAAAEKLGLWAEE